MSAAGWTSAALSALDAGDAVVLATILAVEGSAPRPAGTRMVVTRGATYGTIGGGNLELQVTSQGRHILDHPPGSWRVQDYPLGPLLGQCCGGRVRVQIERLADRDGRWLREADRLTGARAPFVLRHRFGERGVARTIERPGAAGPGIGARGERPSAGTEIAELVPGAALRVVLAGAGHVGCAVARALADLPVALDWFDTRPDFADTGAAAIDEDRALALVAALAPDDALVVMTHDHGLDYRLVAVALHGPARFVGLIGSQTKRARFVSRLARDGVDSAARARLVCPVGMAGIVGKEPAVIAIAVAAQLLMLVGAAR